MQKELDRIKDKYGEKMMHLCRELFPTILETPDLLFTILYSHFDYNKDLYDDIVNNNLVEDFRNYIFDEVHIDVEKKTTNKTVKELLDEAGYDLYECKTQKDIDSFKKYFAKGEEICTFHTRRLDNSYVFFAVKKDVDTIKRKDFPYPERQDKYGTSVISIQFTKGNINTIRITNRYNHKVENSDATFSNNLDNIIPGLTFAFEKEYNLCVDKRYYNNFEIPSYIKTSSLKYIKYNYSTFNTYFCNNNVIVEDFVEVDKYREKEKYLFMDCYILDLQNKRLIAHNQEIVKDSFVYGIISFDKAEIYKTENGKIVIIKNKDKEDIVIELDNRGRIISYKNNNATFIGRKFMQYNTTLRCLEMKNVEVIGDYGLYHNNDLEVLNMPSLREIGKNFMAYNDTIKEIYLPNVERIGFSSFYNNESVENIYMPKLERMDDDVFAYNDKIRGELADIAMYNYGGLKLTI